MSVRPRFLLSLGCHTKQAGSEGLWERWASRQARSCSCGGQRLGPLPMMLFMALS